MEKRVNRNYTQMLPTVSNKSWKQHPTKQYLYNHLPLISWIIQVRQTRHAGHCWGNSDGLINNVLLWTPIHECSSVGQSAKTSIQQLSVNTGCRLEDVLGVMDDRCGWRERVKEICTEKITTNLGADLYHRVEIQTFTQECKPIEQYS